MMSIKTRNVMKKNKKILKKKIVKNFIFYPETNAFDVSKNFLHP